MVPAFQGNPYTITPDGILPWTARGQLTIRAIPTIVETIQPADIVSETHDTITGIMTIKTNKAWAPNAYEGAFFVTGLIGGYYYTSAVRSNDATDITVTEIHSGMTAGAPFYIMRPSTTFEPS